MKKVKHLITILILATFLISGCRLLIDPINIAKNQGEIEEFLQAYPNAEVVAVYMNEEQILKSITDLRNICGEQMLIKEYYIVTIRDLGSDLSIIAYIDAESGRLDCLYKPAIKKEIEEKEKPGKGKDKKKICIDGTLYDDCSIDPPRYCYAGSLVDRCELCGCPTMKECQKKSGRCIPTTPTPPGGNGETPPTPPEENTYSDETSYGSCSTTKPKYCDSGTLINKCSTCGCLSGKECQDDGSCVTVTGEGKIVFASDRSGKAEIWVMNDDGTNLQQLTDETDYSVSPRWSPDGNKIAYLYTGSLYQNNPAELYVMGSDGSDKTLIPSQADSYFWRNLITWDKDGSYIIYEERSSTCSNYLRAVNIDGTDDRVFYDGTDEQEEVVDHHPTLDKIVFFRYVCGGGNKGLHVVNDDGTGLQQLTEAGSPDWFPRWSSDGSMIVWCKESELRVMNADGTNQRRVGNIVGCYPDWAQDDTKLVYHGPHDGVDFASGSDIWIVNLDGSNPVQLTDDEVKDTSPDWHLGQVIIPTCTDGTSYGSCSTTKPKYCSDGVLVNNCSVCSCPEGKECQDDESCVTTGAGKIVFASNRDGNREIYVMNSDGSDQTRLTTDPSYDTMPAWSPDGSKIAFQSNRDGNNEIYVMDSDGSAPTSLTNNPAFDGHPAWSPDGSKIAFMSDRNDSNFEIYVMNADGSAPTRLTNNPAIDYHPAGWSPDGSKIAFYSQRDGNDEIYVMNADGSDQTRLTTDPATDLDPAWSPDGSKIAFTSVYRPGHNDYEVFIMNSDGSSQTDLSNNGAWDGSPAWSPDGRIIFSSTRDGNNEIYVMNSDGSAPTRLTNNTSFDGHPAWSQ